MSIIIRLQNLPLYAKSGDIRNFFGGLRIPDGGVHILGGEKGDAFIAFMSDEDARLAMRKDCGKIKDSRVRLFLSSRMEMQHEVEKITKASFADMQSHKMISPDRALELDANRCRPSERKKRSLSRSPHKYDWVAEKSRAVNDYRQRSRSPVVDRIYSSRGSSTSRFRSRSPRKASRSPKRFLTSQRSPPSKCRTFIQRRKSISPKASSYGHSTHELELNFTSNDVSHCGLKSSEHFNLDQQSPSQSQLQAELEKRITAELEKNYVFRMANFGNEFQECSVPNLNMSLEAGAYQESYPYKNTKHEMSFLPTASNSNVQFQDAKFKNSFTMEKNHLENIHSVDSEMFRTHDEEGSQKANGSFYIILSGLHQHWNFREVQLMLKGIFAPQNHIRFERDHAGYKTGTAFVKLTNKDDFNTVLNKAFSFNGLEITVNECPQSLICKYFPSNSNFQNENFSQNYDLCYTLKGLPFSCTYDDVVKFFHGFEIADLIIFYFQDGRATGTGFVSFTNWKDFEGAISQNGKKIFHRYVEMLPCTQKEMSEAKKSDSNISSFIPYSKLLFEKKLPATRRPLCALITGLPMNTTTKKIAFFFSESDLKPDAIHVTLNKKRLSDGRAFIEFTNFLDFDLALKFHGKQLDGNIICVKQVLYDEMVKILDSQKAQHHFETPAPFVQDSNVPEKVPYLWEPPDASEEQDKVQAGSTPIIYRAGSTYIEPQDNLGHFKLPNRGHENFSPNKEIPINDYFDSHNEEILSPLIPNNPKLNTSENSPQNGENSLKDPVQLNINKPLSMNPKDNESFNSLKRYEENIRTSRLSPANEAALLNFLKDRKAAVKVSNRRSKSPERRVRNSCRDKSLDRIKKEYKDEKIHKSRQIDDSKYKKGRDSRRYDWESDSRHRNPFQCDSSQFETNRRQNKDRSRGCVVHLSNVNASVGTQDLLKFLQGFNFYEDTLIRRYTIEGEPMHDVRVTFFNKHEAEKAIRALNKCYLQNMPISMFIV